MNIGEKIKKIRTLKGYKQNYMAELLHISQKQYSLYESSDANLEWKTIEKIAGVFEIDPVKLISFDESHIFNHCNQSGIFLSSTLSSTDQKIIEELFNQLKIKDEQILKLLEVISTK